MPETQLEIPARDVSPGPAGSATRGVAAELRGARTKLVHLQILRAVAASLVVVDHAYGALIYRDFPVKGAEVPAWEVGSLGVSAFFALSGVIMMMQSGGLSGSLRDAALFLYRRLTRIAPMYWIATMVQLLVMHSWGQLPIHWREEFLLSVSFIPDFVASNGLMQPLLRQGWTLNYEMAFYVLFAAGLLVPRKARLFALLAVLYFASHFRFWPANVANGSVAWQLRKFYTDSIILLFGGGCVMGWLVPRLRWLPKVHAAISPAFLLLVPALAILSHPLGSLGPAVWTGVRWCGLLVVLLCLTEANESLGWVGRSLVLLGDASYSTYLFHNLAVGWAIDSSRRILPRFHLGSPGPRLLIAISLIAANLTGLAIYLTAERPLLQVLKKAKWVQQRG